tara:strand:+ start:18140 stop:18268 length:129 start_codon:yes stop_codon:yes gene_type:complete
MMNDITYIIGAGCISFLTVFSVGYLAWMTYSVYAFFSLKKDE